MANWVCGAAERYMAVYAASTGVPAARDTMLVIDTSSSMNELGNGHPIMDVQAAANDYVRMVANLNNGSVDRIGLVSFDQTGVLRQGLISQQQSPSFSAVTNQISALKLFSGPAGIPTTNKDSVWRSMNSPPTADPMLKRLFFL